MAKSKLSGSLAFHLTTCHEKEIEPFLISKRWSVDCFETNPGVIGTIIPLLQ